MITIEKHWEGNAVPEAPTARFEVRGPGRFIGGGEFSTQVSITGDTSLDLEVPDRTGEYSVNEMSWPENCPPRFAGESRVRHGETAVYVNECDVFPTPEPIPQGVFDFDNWFGFDDGAGSRIFVDEEGAYNCQAVFSPDFYNLVRGTPHDLPTIFDFSLRWTVDLVSGTVWSWHAFLFGGEYEDSELEAFYELRVLSDGGVYFVWHDLRTNEIREIFPGSSAAIKSGVNIMGAVMQGKNLQFYINDVQVLETTLPEYFGGGIGLGCAAGEEGTVHYKFYDLSFSE